MPDRINFHLEGPMARIGAVSSERAAEQEAEVTRVYAGKSETPLVRADSPKYIYLQEAGDGRDGVTWCSDKIANDDTEYVRSDIHEALEKQIARLRIQAHGLWKLLDDIDTLDDAVKYDQTLFRKRCYEIQRKRFEIMSGEEYDKISTAPTAARDGK